jgi:hypothetical protein
MTTPAKCFLAIERLRRLHTGQVLLRMLRHAGFTSAMIAAEVQPDADLRKAMERRRLELQTMSRRPYAWPMPHRRRSRHDHESMLHLTRRSAPSVRSSGKDRAVACALQPLQIRKVAKWDLGYAP